MYIPFSVFCVLFVCKCVLFYCHQLSTQLQLNIYIICMLYDAGSIHSQPVYKVCIDVSQLLCLIVNLITMREDDQQ
jgi:hypothetical protein